MNAQTTEKFRSSFKRLPKKIRKQARAAYRLWRINPFHASLRFRRIRRDGKKVLPHIAVGNKESYDAWLLFLHEMIQRGLKQPLMVIFDGNPGVKKACRQAFPHEKF